MRKIIWFFSSTFIAAGIMFLTNVYYRHVFVDMYHAPFTMKGMIVCHVMDLIMISFSSVVLYLLKGKRRDEKAFRIGISAIPIFDFLFRMIFLGASNSKVDSANFVIGDMVLGTVFALFFGTIVSLIGGALLADFINDIGFKEKERRKLPYTMNNVELNRIITDINLILPFFKRNSFKRIEKLITQYNKTIQSYQALNGKQRENCKEEIKEMISVLESSLKEVLTEAENRKEKEVKNNLKTFYHV